MSSLINNLIWFDDGYLNTYEVAYPILKRYGLTAILSVVTGRVGVTINILGGKARLMTLEQIRTLVEDGWEIAGHSHTHPTKRYDGYGFAALSLEETRVEVEESKKWIEENLGVTPTKFVAPNASVTKEQMELIRNYYPYIRPPRGRTEPLKGYMPPGSRLLKPYPLLITSGENVRHLIYHVVNEEGLLSSLRDYEVI